MTSSQTWDVPPDLLWDVPNIRWDVSPLACDASLLPDLLWDVPSQPWGEALDLLWDVHSRPAVGHPPYLLEGVSPPALG